MLAPLRDWTKAGVWDQLHALLLAELHAADQIDWSRAAVDGSHVRAKRRLCVSRGRRLSVSLVGDQALIDHVG